MRILALQPQPLREKPYPELTQLYLDQLRASGRALNTQLATAYDLNLLASLLNELGQDFLTLDADGNRGLFELMKTRGDAQSSIDRRYAIWRSFASFLQYMDESLWQGSNPFDTSIMGERTRVLSATPALSPGDIEKVRKSLQEKIRSGVPMAYRDTALFEVLVDTGAGVSDVVDLKWDNFNAVRATLLLGSGKQRRTLNLSKGCVTNLNHYSRSAITSDVARRTGESPIFIGKHGPLTANGIQRILRNLGEDLDPAIDVSPRRLRATRAAQLFASGIPIDEIAQNLGCAPDRSSKLLRCYSDGGGEVDAL